MQRESFSSERVARVLNEAFVSIKVDREERTDVDELYMSAVMQLTGSGGWPLTVFLSPEGQPFHGGTYYPPYRSGGLPSFLEVLGGIARGWSEKRANVLREAARITGTIERSARFDARGPLDPSTLDKSLEALESSFDPMWGGFGDAPKFPRATDLRLLLIPVTMNAPLAMALASRRMAAADPGSPRRRSPLQHRRALVGPPLREDAHDTPPGINLPRGSSRPARRLRGHGAGHLDWALREMQRLLGRSEAAVT
jgi:hypothetical protein